MSQSIVLCVDDDTTVLNALRTLLSKMLGNAVIVEIAESGQEALEICADFEAEGKEVGVVISDFIMPGMRGDELLVRMHEKNPGTVKIMLTGQSDLSGVKRTINEANLYRFLEKPFNNADLVLTAKSALEAYNKERRMERRIAELEQLLAEKEKLLAARG
jgi:DNA-binding NtrC family response regulator